MNPFDILKQMRRSETDNPFRPRTPKEKKEQLQKEKEVQQEVLNIAQVCEDILKDQRYKAFADLFKDIEKNIADLLINCDEENRDKYFLKMREYQFKLRFFRSILKMPHEFIERGEEIRRTVVK